MVKEGLMYSLGVALVLFALICFWIVPCLGDAFDKGCNLINSLIAIIIAIVLFVGVIAFAFAI